MKLPKGTLTRAGLGLVGVAVILAVVLQARILVLRSHVGQAQAALKDFAEALAPHDGEIDIHQERTVTIAGRRIRLRAVARRASALPNPPPGRTVIEMRGLPCGVAEALDARIDDGNLATGNVRASVASCAVGGANAPVPVMAFSVP